MFTLHVEVTRELQEVKEGARAGGEELGAWQQTSTGGPPLD